MRRAAVLGAGVMGAQIAAHLVNAGVAVRLFDLPAREGPPDAPILRAIEGLKKLEPAPLALPQLAASITACTYDRDLAALRECDLVIEAIGERMDWKRELYARIAPHIGPDAVLASNTSGLSLGALAEALPDGLRARFCGVHFFNPPRYMHLVELIATPKTDAALLDALETFLTTALGKGVIRARDTPNFIANRIGIFSVLATLRHAATLQLPYDVVDALTGTAIGRAKSATYRTADVVGLDTLSHVVKTMRDGLPDDPWHPLFDQPPVLAALVAKGALGQKSGRGFLSQGRPRDPGARSGCRRLSALRRRSRTRGRRNPRDRKDPGERFAALRGVLASASAVPVVDLPRSVPLRGVPPREHRRQRARSRSCDSLGLRLAAGPVRDLAARGMATGRRMDFGGYRRRAHACSGAASAVGQLTDGGADGGCVFTRSGRVFAARPTRAGRVLRCPSTSASGFPIPCVGESFERGTTMFETDALRMWHLRDDVGIVSFRTKQNTVERRSARWAAARDRRGGTRLRKPRDLAAARAVFARREPGGAGAGDGGEAVGAPWRRIVAKFQDTSHAACATALIPTVAAVRGMALGGSCEFILHCDRVVAAHESYIGLVETGVGLLPGGAAPRSSPCALPLGAKADRWRPARYVSVPARRSSRPLRWRVCRAVRRMRESWASCATRTSSSCTPTSCCTSRMAKAHALARCRLTGRRCRARDIAVAGRTGIATLADAARQHARRRIHPPPTISRLRALRTGTVRRRRRSRQPRGRALAARCRARGIHGAAARRAHAGAHRAHAQDGQAAAQDRLERELPIHDAILACDCDERLERAA